MPFVFSDLREEVRLTGPGIVSDLLVCRDHLRRFSLGLTSTFARAVGVDDHEPQDDAAEQRCMRQGNEDKPRRGRHQEVRAADLHGIVTGKPDDGQCEERQSRGPNRRTMSCGW